jgi:hypothetical protein
LTTKFTQHTDSLTAPRITTDVVIPSEARNLLFFRPAEASATNTPLKLYGPSCLLIARNAYQAFAHQQAMYQALIKIYVAL